MTVITVGITIAITITTVVSFVIVVTIGGSPCPRCGSHPLGGFWQYQRRRRQSWTRDVVVVRVPAIAAAAVAAAPAAVVVVPKLKEPPGPDDRRPAPRRRRAPKRLPGVAEEPPSVVSVPVGVVPVGRGGPTASAPLALHGSPRTGPSRRNSRSVFRRPLVVRVSIVLLLHLWSVWQQRERSPRCVGRWWSVRAVRARRLGGGLILRWACATSQTTSHLLEDEIEDFKTGSLLHQRLTPG
jgi:hypothetical protein